MSGIRVLNLSDGNLDEFNLDKLGSHYFANVFVTYKKYKNKLNMYKTQYYAIMIHGMFKMYFTGIGAKLFVVKNRFS